MWVAVIFFDRQFLTLFGAEETLLPLAREYMYPIKFVVPSFLFTQFMSAFLRNDGDPALATKAVLAGGIFNMFGNYFFVFTLDRGIMGAGIATSMGSVFSLIIMLTHFFKKKNSLHMEKPTQLLVKLCAIGTTGFSTFFIDVAMGILTMIFNRQCSEHCPGIIRRYGISFILLPFNIFSTYYFQAMMKPSTAFVVSVGRGAVISGHTDFLLPVMAGANSIWFAMPITEMIVAVFVAAMMRRYQKQPIRSAVQK